MNKKLLFGIMSLAALTACTNDDFESQKVAQEASPIQFEVLNNDALTRATMDGNKIQWSAKDGDLFTLYHGCTLPNAGQNAIYKASAEEGSAAVLSTPSMILEGKAIMVWPADTAFTITDGTALSIKIPEKLTNIEKNIPYLSDVVDIAGYNKKAPYNTAGYNRSYPIFMRPMASQLIVKADYAKTDEKIAELYEGGKDGLSKEEAITPIKVESIELESPTDKFTTKIELAFTAKTTDDFNRWKAVPNNAWSDVTGFGAVKTSVDKLTTTVLDGNAGCKFLILPQDLTAATDKKVVVNTIYGKVEVSATNYGGAIDDAWYRFISKDSKDKGPGVGYLADETVAAKAETEGDNKDKFKTTANIVTGMAQTIGNKADATSGGFSNYKATSGVAKTEPVGAAATRYVKVLLTKLDMTDLHIKSDKQLRDVARVWDKLGLSDVTVRLDGVNGVFEMSQNTIKVINAINAKYSSKAFKVMPCEVAGEKCETIKIFEGGDVQNIAFIKANGSIKAVVELKAGETWNWKGTVKVGAADVKKIINKGTMENAADAVLKTTENDGTQNNVLLVNDYKWNINKPAVIRVQFDVTNNGIVTIEKGAQYRQDGAFASTFTNDATAKPSRFGGNDKKIGTIWNYGVFATLGTGTAAKINNYGLIEHADVDAKTYVTANQTSGAVFTTAFGAANKMGRINLPWGNKDEDNVSISAELTQGFVSVTVDGEVTGALSASQLGNKVNYLIIKSGPTAISNVASQVDYLEVDMGKDSEIAWSVFGSTQNFVGLMVLSDINIKLNTKVNVTGATFLGADMYVGGNFTWGSWSGYYGDTSGNVGTKYITY